MKPILHCVILIFCFLSFSAVDCFAKGETVRKERRMILKGNEYFKNKQFKLASQCYSEALKANPGSDVAMFNLGLTQLKLSSDKNDTTSLSKSLREKGIETMKKVAALGASKPLLASKAVYNLGNIDFEAENYGEAVKNYKQSLRLNPKDNAARRNLRIAQLKLQNQNNKDDKQDKQDNKDKDQQDNKQDQNQQDNKDNQDQQNQENRQNPPKDNELDNKTADQILKSVENKENQTRARMNASGTGEKSKGQATYQKNW